MIGRKEGVAGRLGLAVSSKSLVLEGFSADRMI